MFPGEPDERRFFQLVEARTGERAGLAAKLTACLEQSHEQLSRAYRQQLANKPEAPSGLAALFGRAKFETAHAAWHKRTKQIEKRISDVQKRHKTTRNVMGQMEAQRLATAKVKHAQPELWQRVELYRSAKRILQQMTALDTNQSKTIESSSRSRGRSR